MKTLPEVEQSSDDQFHAFMALFLNCYKDMRGKISKAGMQLLIKDKERLTNEMILFLNNSGMTNDSHLFDLTKPMHIPDKDGGICDVAYFDPQGHQAWDSLSYLLPIAGSSQFEEYKKYHDGKEYLDLNELRKNGYSDGKSKKFANDCILDHLLFDFHHLIPKEWDFPILALGTGYSRFPGEFWYKMIAPNYNNNWHSELVFEKLFFNRETRYDKRFKLSEVRILVI